MTIYRPIIGALGYILSPDAKRTLMVHRNKRPSDQHFGKYNGLGGKMLPGEDIHACIRREIFEEAGIVCTQIVLRGIINWTGFGPQGEDWLGFVYRIDAFSGQPFAGNEEGDLVWIEVAAMMELPMWEGDRHFLPLVFDDDPRLFSGYMPYAGGRPLDWRFERM